MKIRFSAHPKVNAKKQERKKQRQEFHACKTPIEKKAYQKIRRFNRNTAGGAGYEV